MKTWCATVENSVCYQLAVQGEQLCIRADIAQLYPRACIEQTRVR